ncbi:g10600 [Coccomyxa elongata]
MAFNLGEAGVTVDSSRNASAEVLDRIKKAAVDNMVPLLGHSLALDRILEHLTTGPAAAAHHANDRRHGPGQSLTNNTHRQFVADMADRFGDDAKRGVSHFVSDENRKQIYIDHLDSTWALVKSFPDAFNHYGTNPISGKEYNSSFKKCCVRKFGELAKASSLPEMTHGELDPDAVSARPEQSSTSTAVTEVENVALAHA